MSQSTLHVRNELMGQLFSLVTVVRQTKDCLGRLAYSHHSQLILNIH